MSGYLTLDQCRQRLNQPDLPVAERVQVLCRLALLLLAANQLPEAIATCHEAQRLQPDAPLAHHYQAMALERLGHYQAALASYDRAIAVSAQPTADLWCARGAVLRRLGRYSAALTSYETALAQQPECVRALSAMGSLLAMVGKSRQALEVCDRALTLQPDSAEAWNSRGVVLSMMGRYQAALNHYQKALDYQPDFDRALCNRGIARVRLDCYPEALADLEAALHHDPQTQDYWKVTAWTHHGYALMRLGQFHTAIASFDAALHIKPDHYPAALYRLANLVASGTWLAHLTTATPRRHVWRDLVTVLTVLKGRLLLLAGLLVGLVITQGIWADALRQLLPVVLCLGIIALIVTDLWTHRAHLDFVWKTYCHNNWLTYLRAASIVIITLVTYSKADSIAPHFLRWGWADWVFGQPGNVIFQPFNFLRSANPMLPMNLVAMAIAPSPALSWVTSSGFDYSVLLIGAFWLLLMLGIPFWARLEERIFRRGANTWPQIGIRSTLFGLAHLIAGIPILAGLVLIVPGFLFACRYKYVHDRHLNRSGDPIQAQDAGVAASTADHAVYNAILVTLAVVTLLLG